MSNVNYLLRLAPGLRAKSMLCHVDRIQHFSGEPSLAWDQARLRLADIVPLADAGSNATSRENPTVENSYLPPVERENRNITKNGNTAADRRSLEPSTILGSANSHTDSDTRDRLNLNGKKGAEMDQKPQYYTTGKTNHSKRPARDHRPPRRYANRVINPAHGSKLPTNAGVDVETILHSDELSTNQEKDNMNSKHDRGNDRSPEKRVGPGLSTLFLIRVGSTNLNNFNSGLINMAEGSRRPSRSRCDTDNGSDEERSVDLVQRSMIGTILAIFVAYGMLMKVGCVGTASLNMAHDIAGNIQWSRSRRVQKRRQPSVRLSSNRCQPDSVETSGHVLKLMLHLWGPQLPPQSDIFHRRKKPAGPDRLRRARPHHR